MCYLKCSSFILPGYSDVLFLYSSHINVNLSETISSSLPLVNTADPVLWFLKGIFSAALQFQCYNLDVY